MKKILVMMVISTLALIASSIPAFGQTNQTNQTTTTTTTSTTTTTTTPTTTTTTTIYSNETPQQIVYENISEYIYVGSNLTATDVEVLIDKLLDAYQQNYTRANLDLSMFKAMFDVSCMYTEDRFEQFMNNYNSLSDLGKRCFQKFLTENITNAMFFAQSCASLYGNTFVSQSLLDEYLKKDVAERRCEIINVPSVVQSPTGGYMQSYVQQPICNYYPARISNGCLKRVNFMNAQIDDSYNNGFVWGFGVTFLIVLFIIFIIIVRGSTA